jgi:hypothetical protein
LGGCDCGGHGNGFRERTGRLISDQQAGMRLRNEIYAMGDSRDVNESIEKFLGRKQSVQPFLKKIGIGEASAPSAVTLIRRPPAWSYSRGPWPRLTSPGVARAGTSRYRRSTGAHMKLFVYLITLTLFTKAFAADPEMERLKPALDAITPDGLLAHIKILSSDEFEGPRPGSKGEELSIKYISDQFKTDRIEPGKPDGTYFQKVPLAGIKTTPSGPSPSAERQRP